MIHVPRIADSRTPTDSELLRKSHLAKSLRDSHLTQFSSHFSAQVIEICHGKESKVEFRWINRHRLIIWQTCLCYLRFDKCSNRAQHNERATVKTTDHWLGQISPLVEGGQLL
jgi:hypothetical protein